MRSLPAPRASVLAFLVAVSASVPLVAAGCSDDTSGDGGIDCPSGDFSLCEVPRIDVTPASVEVLESAQQVGETRLLGVTVLNPGTRALVLESVRVEYTPPPGGDDAGGGEPAFRLDGDFDGKKVDHAEGTEFPKELTIAVAFTRQADGIPRTATLVVESDAFGNDRVEVPFETVSGTARIGVEPKSIDFGLVPDGVEQCRDLKIFNSGTQTLFVGGATITKHCAYEVKQLGVGGCDPGDVAAVDLEEAIEILPGNTALLEVCFTSDSPEPAEGNLVVYSNDPDSGATGLLVPLSANKSGPAIVWSPKKIDFGGKKIGTISSIDLEIESAGTSALTITGVVMAVDSSEDFGFDFENVDPPEFAFEPGPLDPWVLEVNQIVHVPVTFQPNEVNPKDADNEAIPDTGVVEVHSDAFLSQIDVPVSGAGAEGECPIACITVEEGEEVPPQTVLHLDSSCSTAPIGSVAGYEWSVTGPAGSVSKFVPSATNKAPVFQPNVVGLYTFSLKVRDEKNTPSCNIAEYKVIVKPDQAIHVELTWVTPKDQDESDECEGCGSDVDLHFAHPSAMKTIVGGKSQADLDGDGRPDPWFSDPWDSFWYNGEPNWGNFDPNAKDNPTLDRDDTDGAGPENLNLVAPEPSLAQYHISPDPAGLLPEGIPPAYTVGVHYWKSHGFGDVTATVRIFVYAELVYEATHDLKERDMWCVRRVPWPFEAGLTTTEPCLEGHPEVVADYVNANFFPF